MKYTVTCSVCGKKQRITDYKPVLERHSTIYPEFCPDPVHVLKYDIGDVLQRCRGCGYTFPRIDEVGIDLDKDLVQSEEYCHPFGERYTSDDYAVKCYQVALAYRRSECFRFATAWYIKAALMLPEYSKERIQCFRDAWITLRWEKEKVKRPWNKGNWNFEMNLTDLNLKRLLGMYDEVKEETEREKIWYTGTEKHLLEKLYEMSVRGDSSYKTYMEMLMDEEDKYGTW